jgi:hypothetical protein
LFLTDKRLVFRPNRIDSITGGKPWACDLGQIDAVGASPPDGQPFSGGIRTRLRVETTDADVERFVVNHLDEVIDYLQTEVGTVGGQVPRRDEPRSRSVGPWVITFLVFASVIALILLSIFVLH